MSFVPVTGPATFRPADPPRDGTIEFTGERRAITLPIRAALPVLSRARSQPDVHPSVALLGGAALLAGRFVAAGKLVPDGGASQAGLADRRPRRARPRQRQPARPGPGLRRRSIPPPPPRWSRRSSMPSPTRCRGRRRCASRPGPDGSRTARPASELLDQRGEPTSPSGSAAGSPSAPGPSSRAAPSLPELVRVSLRVEADEEELDAGSVRVALQVHDERDPLHVCDAALLWTDGGGARVRPAGAGAREHRAPRGRRGVAGARPPAGAVGARPADPRRRGDRQPARPRRRAPRRPGRRALATGARPRPDDARRARAARRPAQPRAPAPGQPVRGRRAVRVLLAGRAARRDPHRRGDGAAGDGRVAGPQAPWRLDRRRSGDRRARAQAPDPQGHGGAGTRRRPQRGGRASRRRRGWRVRAGRHRRGRSSAPPC